MSPPTSFAKSKAKHFETVFLLMHKFLINMNYTPININSLNEELEAFMVKVMDSRNIRCTQLEKTVHLAASLVELCYPQLTMQEKKLTALLNWLLIYVDDQVPKEPMPFRHFEQRFFRGLPQLDPVMNVLADVLHQVWGEWDTLAANLIVRAAMNFMTYNCVEVGFESGAPPTSNNPRFAWLLRQGAGVALPYGCFGFSKSTKLSAVDYAQVVADMEYWIDLTNDLLSYYKEELNGDTNNYVHVRAKNENKSVLEVLAEIEAEMVTSRDLIHAELAHNPRALQIWKAMEQGYLHWHLIQDRYKLANLGLLNSFSKH